MKNLQSYCFYGKMRSMKTSDFDNKFDDGQDIISFLDVKNAHRPALQQKRVNVDFPLWMANKIDK